MAFILHIETSTRVCSVAISQDDKLLFYKEDTEGPSHASLLGVFVQEAVDELYRYKKKPDAVSVSAGPGSYTGLRIGVSEAKGLCYGWDVPLIAVETLKLLTFQVINERKWDDNVLFCPMLDARRMEVYTCLFDKNFNKIKDTSAQIIDESSFMEYLQKQPVVFFGNGAEKCKDVICSPNSTFLENKHPKARDMVALANVAYRLQDFVDTAYYEPFYLKEFVGTIPKNKVLG